MYDVIIVGSHVGGALTAALLAKRNHRVLLIDHDGTGTGYEHGGYVLPFCEAAPRVKHLDLRPAPEKF